MSIDSDLDPGPALVPKKPARAENYVVQFNFKSGLSQTFKVKAEDFLVASRNGTDVANLVFTPVGFPRPRFIDTTAIESVWILCES